jgi:hypothetical protein
MAFGLPGADSSIIVTHQINGRTLIDLATDLFGQTPVWGRYFTSAATSGLVEYRALRENPSVAHSRHSSDADRATDPECRRE